MNATTVCISFCKEMLTPSQWHHCSPFFAAALLANIYHNSPTPAIPVLPDESDTSAPKHDS